LAKIKIIVMKSFKEYCLYELKEERIVRFYHGGSSLFNTEPKIMDTKKGRYEYGPGIYLTTSYDTARKYAKGNKVVHLVEIKANKIVLPIDIKIELTDTIELISKKISMSSKNREKMISDLKRSFEQRQYLTANTVISLLVNNEVLKGSAGPKVSEWLSHMGVTADFNQMSNEEWLIVFNPAIISSSSIVPVKQVGSIEFPYDLPLVSKNYK